jgi:outer membrane lipoprotein SlyB
MMIVGAISVGIIGKTVLTARSKKTGVRIAGKKEKG